MLWSKKEKKLLRTLRSSMTTSEIHEVFRLLGYDRSIEAIQKQSKKLRIVFTETNLPDFSQLSAEESILVREIAGRRHPLDPPPVITPGLKAKKTTAIKNYCNRAHQELAEIRATLPRTSSLSFRRAKDPEKQSLVVMISDNHVGKELYHPETGELLYNLDIACSRLAETPNVAAQTYPDLNAFDEVVIALLGDHVDGEGVYPHQAMNLEEHAAEQVRRSTLAMWQMLLGFRDLFPLVRVATIRGNHGGTASPEANFDNILFNNLEILADLNDDPNLVVKTRYGEFNTLEVKGWKAMLRHKAPAQASTASGRAKFAGWYGIHHWDFLMYGHFHHWGIDTWCDKMILRNGSMVGGDDYAESLAAYDSPTQLSFALSEETLPVEIRPLRYKNVGE